MPVQENVIQAGEDFAPVSSTRRFLNFVIDLSCWLFFTFLLSLFLDLSTLYDRKLFGSSLVTAGFFAYYTIMEFCFQRSLGKFVTRTMVVNLDGSKPGLGRIVLRNLCRCIPFDRISFLFTRRGFHDYFSKTKVIDQPVDNHNTQNLPA